VSLLCVSIKHYNEYYVYNAQRVYNAQLQRQIGRRTLIMIDDWINYDYDFLIPKTPQRT